MEKRYDNKWRMSVRLVVVWNVCAHTPRKSHITFAKERRVSCALVRVSDRTGPSALGEEGDGMTKKSESDLAATQTEREWLR